MRKTLLTLLALTLAPRRRARVGAQPPHTSFGDVVAETPAPADLRQDLRWRVVVVSVHIRPDFETPRANRSSTRRRPTAAEIAAGPHSRLANLPNGRLWPPPRVLINTKPRSTEAQAERAIGRRLRRRRRLVLNAETKEITINPHARSPNPSSSPRAARASSSGATPRLISSPSQALASMRRRRPLRAKGERSADGAKFTRGGRHRSSAPRSAKARP